MFKWIIILLISVCLVTAQNSTDDLKVRVTLLEDDVADLQDDVEEVETSIEEIRIINALQDDRLNIIDEAVNDNDNEINDLGDSVDDTQNTIIILQQQMTELQETNTLLLERIDELETDAEISHQQITELQSAANTTNQESEQLEDALNTTNEIVEVHGMDIQDTTSRLTSVERDVTEQGIRLTVIESNVDLWGDRILVLELANTYVQERLTTVEDIILTPWVSCVSSPCDNGGTCVDVNIDTFVCLCRDGYYGETCQYNPLEACSSSPCDNSGTCIDVNVDTFVCVCRDGYFGTDCGQSYASTAFLASFDYDPGIPGDPIIFNVAPLNPGGHYDVTPGLYTVPIDGIYEFMFYIWVNDDWGFNAYLEVDNVQIFRGTSLEGTYDDPFLHVAGLLSLTAGQQVWISPNGLGGMQGTGSTYYESWFGGHLVYAV